MNELRKAVKAINLALRTIWIADATKKIAIIFASVFCVVLYLQKIKK